MNNLISFGSVRRVPRYLAVNSIYSVPPDPNSNHLGTDGRNLSLNTSILSMQTRTDGL